MRAERISFGAAAAAAGRPSAIRGTKLARRRPTANGSAAAAAANNNANFNATLSLAAIWLPATARQDGRPECKRRRRSLASQHGKTDGWLRFQPHLGASGEHALGRARACVFCSASAKTLARAREVAGGRVSARLIDTRRRRRRRHVRWPERAPINQSLRPAHTLGARAAERPLACDK